MNKDTLILRKVKFFVTGLRTNNCSTFELTTDPKIAKMCLNLTGHYVIYQSYL